MSIGLLVVTALGGAIYAELMRLGRLMDAGTATPAEYEMANGNIPFGETPLHVASQEGKTDVVTRLLAAGANVNAADSYGKTPLWIASQEGHADVVQLLQAAGARE